MIPYLDIHTHHTKHDPGVRAIYNWIPQRDSSYPVDAFGVSLGIHPHYISAEHWERDLYFIDQSLKHSRFKLIGECGLDRLTGPSLSLQQEVFRRQLDLADKHRKPVLIHCVRAFDELLSCTRPFLGKVPLIIHGYSKSLELARELSRKGFLLSFGQSLVKNHPGANAYLAETNSNFFLESDESSQPIEEIYETAAFLRKISVDQLKDVIFAHWKNINLL